MSPLIRGLTIGLLALPAIFAGAALAFPGGRFGVAPLAATAAFLVAIYAWVWLGFRPTRFVVTQDAIEVTWPLKRRAIARSTIKDARLLARDELKRMVGWGRARRRGRAVGRLRLAVDGKARHRADVRLTHRPLRLDRARRRAAVAHHARPPGSVRPPRHSSHAKRLTAIHAKSALHPSIAATGIHAASRPRPRQVIASSPSIAHRAGTYTVALCSHSGNTNVGTRAPPSIPRSKVARMARPRVASGVLPSAAIKSPKVDVSNAKAMAMPANPITLPSMRTPKATMAAA